MYKRQELYAPASDESVKPGERVFYTRRNAEYLDTARTQISRLPPKLQIYFLAPLIAKASVHANTSGVFKGFYKSKDGIGQFGGHGQDALTRIKRNIEIELPVLSRFSCEYQVTRADANAYFDTSSSTEFDLAYLDPPYNFRQYTSYYFMLNLLSSHAEIDDLDGFFSRIEFVRGQNMDTDFKSSFCSKASFVPSLKKLIERS